MKDLHIPLGEHRLAATLHLPAHPRGVVVFVHGSGVDRRDARDAFVAGRLRRDGLATLQPELLEAWQAAERHNVFDIELQCERLLELLAWLDACSWAKGLPLAFYAAGIGAGVALLAAAKRPGRVGAVICRGGRPDSALFWLPLVQAPTLLMMEAASPAYARCFEKLAGQKEMVTIPTAGSFDEPEALDAMAEHARRWLARHLLARHSRAA